MLPQADRFAAPGAAAPVAVRTSAGEIAGSALLDAATSAGLTAGARLASNLPWTLLFGLARTLLAAFAVDGSLVYSDSVGDALVAQADAERATVTTGFDAPGLPRLDAPGPPRLDTPGVPRLDTPGVRWS